ncbi:hypothetical protein Zm00014a_002787 [Zea mays]|uniref:Afadin/alpha-actinin-binding protein n=2 Tax=Zea mays TaxID=4577 RepID=A0A3L6F5S7_MAIZE|nr:hypothetical protein Zm00014a_002787 [Zea mays]
MGSWVQQKQSLSRDQICVCDHSCHRHRGPTLPLPACPSQPGSPHRPRPPTPPSQPFQIALSTQLYSPSSIHHPSPSPHRLPDLYPPLPVLTLSSALWRMSSSARFDLRASSHQLQPPPSHASMSSDGGAFANAENLEHCARYLNQTLVTFGFPASLDLFATDPVSIARTCNCIYALLQQRQRDIEFRESTNDQRQRMQSDISRLEAKIERMDAQLAAKDRELATLTRTEAKNTAALKSQIDKLQQERDEFQKMVIGNQKEGRQRGTWNGKKNDNDYYKMIVDAYEVKKQELMQENADLRALLRSMQMDMRDFLNAPNGSSQSTVTDNGRQESGSPQSPLGGKTDVFDLPFHMARDQIEESLRTKMTSIKARMTQLQDAQKGAEVTSEATDRELELEAQLVEARSIIQEQACIMSKHFKSDKPR